MSFPPDEKKPILQRIQLVLQGQVQGVGFRPWVSRLASRFHLTGHVQNNLQGLTIEVEGDTKNIEAFTSIIREEPLPLARIDQIQQQVIAITNRPGFAILASSETGPTAVRIPKDLAICSECIKEFNDSTNQRAGYAFISCTSCGPRFSIVESLPYDRNTTTMRHFPFCDTCNTDYHNCLDRRYHAETSSCPKCGPQIQLQNCKGINLTGPENAISLAQFYLQEGKILAVKGLGGFQLLVRADDSLAVQRLRERKSRPAKPLAVMVRSLAIAETLAELNSLERQTLQSPYNSIVIVNCRENSYCNRLAQEVNPGVGTLGLFLPTTPLHLLLLQDLDFPIITTSGNQSGAPLATSTSMAMESLGAIADAFLQHDRNIQRPLDDSVVRILDDKVVVLRSARGFAPLTIPSLERLAQSKRLPPILATGGQQNVAIAAWTGTQVVLAPHIGDMDSQPSREAFRTAVEDIKALYDFSPHTIACDRHPDYFTTRWSENSGLVWKPIQHHHAHALACLAEHDLLDREALAITWDGTGYGMDGTIWGGEFLQVNGQQLIRRASLLSFPLPGGEAAILHPNRCALGLLYVLLGPDAMLKDAKIPLLLNLPPSELRLQVSMIQRGIQSPWTSSVGRLFDGMASLILGIHTIYYEGEAAIRLESLVDRKDESCWTMQFRTDHPDGISRGDWRPMLEQLLSGLDQKVPAAILASRFHQTLVNWALAQVSAIDLPSIVLTGGCFQNRTLTEWLAGGLRKTGRTVLTHQMVPPGDGGLAVGQLAAVMCASETSAS